MKVINENKRLLFTLKEKTSGILVIAPEELILVDESLKQTTPVDPRPYKVYTALLTQSGTDAPVATVLENTLGGDILWSYSDIGVYIATTAQMLPDNKVTTLVYNNKEYDPTGTYGYALYKTGSNKITSNSVATDGDYTNGLLYNTPIEIRVYN